MARFAKITTVFALVCAIGGNFILLQSIAWTTMLADHLRNDSLTVAVEKTFDGKHPCPLCKQIAAAKQKEKKEPSSVQLKKFEFAADEALFVFVAPQDFKTSAETQRSFHDLTHQPPSPPPRPA